MEEALFQILPENPTQDWIKLVGGLASGPVSEKGVALINAPAYDLVLRGGKRWRPQVMYLTYRMVGGVEGFPHGLGAMVELPHNGSLIIDDIEDHSTERRGAPAIHLTYGLDMAINSGNFLYFLPTYFLDTLELPIPVKYRMTRIYLEIMRRLHFGQGLDIQWHNDHGYVPEIQEYLQMCRFKTGSLSCMAAQLGASLVTDDEKLIRDSGSVWEDIGVGFQIMDDVKNLLTGNPGKMRGDDIIEGKKSLPVILHCMASEDGGASLMALFQKVREERASNPNLQPLVEEAISMMNSTAAIIEARDQAQALLDSALSRLLSLYPPSAFLDSARAMVEGFLQTFNVKVQ